MVFLQLGRNGVHRIGDSVVPLKRDRLELVVGALVHEEFDEEVRCLVLVNFSGEVVRHAAIFRYLIEVFVDTRVC